VGNPKVIFLGNFEIGQEYLVNPVATGGDTSLSAWIITGYTGEKMTNPPFYSQFDTGLNDGTIYN
jgi:hypothetical protein